MLLILMYHRVHGLGSVPAALRRHFAYLRDHHPVLLPGDPVPRGELAVCLTFDDATVDFYQEVHPLLEALDLRALVAVPTRYIDADSDVPMEQRLVAQGLGAMSGDYAAAGSPLCTWRELAAMQAGGRVRCASHGHGHTAMTDPGTDPEAELTHSKETLTAQLGQAPDTFVYPYGDWNPAVQTRVRHHYRYAMRIGSALNEDWDANGGLLYRVDAERFWPQGRVWSFSDLVKYRMKRLANRLRGR